jgi:uncharacterized cupredoxin-like copper-binding protein
MKSRKYLALLMVVLAVALAACSGGGASTEIEADLKEFAFDPQSWEIPAGEQITITLTNSGTIAHEWVLLKPGVTIASEADLPETEEELLSDFVYWEEEVEPGDTATFTFTAPAEGTYQIICAIEGHFGGGMEGSLTVVPAEA